MQRKLDVQFISTHDQLTDGFTKQLPQQRFSDFCNNLNLDKLRLKGVLDESMFVASLNHRVLHAYG
jgi:hypothetical protein